MRALCAIRDRYLLQLAVLLCLIVGLWCVFAVPLLFYEDAVHYVSLGAHLAAGKGYHSSLLRFPDLMQPPLYPLLIGLLDRVIGDPVRAAIAICICAQALTVVALYLLHREVWPADRRGRLCTAFIAALYPNLAFGAALVLEPLFLCLIAFAMYLAFSAVRSGRLGRAALSGLCLGLALLTRPEVVITGACAAALLFLWPGPQGILRRGLRVVCLIVPAALLVLPYGLWMKHRIGVFEVLPKVRYNLALADITENMAWGPGEERLSGREQRTFFTLMPDHTDFVMNYAFNHEGFDPRQMFPRRAEQPGAGRTALLDLLRSAREVVADAVVHTGAFNPVALLLMLLAAWHGLVRPETRLLCGTLLLLVALHMGPAVLSGADYTSRYLAASLLFSVPLVGAGTGLLADRLGSRGRLLAGGALLLCYGAATVHVLRTQTGGPGRWERTALIQQAVRQYIPEGARVLAEHSRYTFLRHGEAFQLPYACSPAELADYIAAHHIEYAIFDSLPLRRNPSRVDRMLADPRNWPQGAVALAELLPGADPVWIVKLP